MLDMFAGNRNSHTISPHKYRILLLGIIKYNIRFYFWLLFLFNCSLKILTIKLFINTSDFLGFSVVFLMFYWTLIPELL